MNYSREEGGRRQSLELRPRGADGYEATISVAGGCSRTETGIAKELEVPGDGEVEVDPDGEGHPTDSFLLAIGKECRVIIRLAAPDR